MNKVILCGRLGRDPEVKDGEMKIARWSLATNGYAKGEKTTDWHNCVAFGKTAEIAERFLVKGSQALCEGRIQTRKYTGKDGTEKWATDVIVERLELVGGKGESEKSEASAIAAQEFGDDEIPF